MPRPSPYLETGTEYSVQVASQDGYKGNFEINFEFAALLLSPSKQLKCASKGLHSKPVTMLPLLQGGAGRY